MPPEGKEDIDAFRPSDSPPNRHLPQHGIRGVYYGGDWVDIEDCAGTFNPKEGTASETRCDSCKSRCRRSRTRHVASKSQDDDGADKYDCVVIGAGCIGGAIARELSRYRLSVLLLDAADDVSQGATKGNSGIVHAGYDDKPGTNRAKFCWTGNQMFPQLDRELRFGYQKNGSLVLATSGAELKILDDLLKRGETNGVKNLRILNRDELRALEPAVNPNAVGALHSPDAGNVIPYEYSIALVENAADNGVEVRIRREVVGISRTMGGDFVLDVRHWEPQSYADAHHIENGIETGSEVKRKCVRTASFGAVTLSTTIVAAMGIYMALDASLSDDVRRQATLATAVLVVAGLVSIATYLNSRTKGKGGRALPCDFKGMVDDCSPPVGKGGSGVVVSDMFTGGSGSWNAVQGVTVSNEIVKSQFVVNCAGGASDKIAHMIGDYSFQIKPRLGDYLLLNRNQGHLTRHTLFPCPDPILGKGVLVQTTLWGNLILGPTARDTYKAEARDMSPQAVQEYILSKCKALVPYFDPKETIHAFCGARAKSDRGDWIIEPSSEDMRFIHAAGIDSPGLAGSPAIAIEVVRLLRKAGLETPPDPDFNPNRAPIITPKVGMRGLKMGPVGKNDSDGTEAEEAKMRSNVVCKCEKVTEMEVVRAMRRSLPIDSTQAIRKRTRAGMGHCQGDPDNYNCECRVKAIIARENGVPVKEVGGRPWPATSTLSQRWIEDDEKAELEKRMMK